MPFIWITRISLWPGTGLSQVDVVWFNWITRPRDFSETFLKNVPSQYWKQQSVDGRFRTCAGLRQVDVVLAEGLVAYSEDQAVIQEALEAEFGLLWDAPLDSREDSGNKKGNTNDNDGKNNDDDTDYEEGINGGDYNDDDDDVKEVPEGYLG